MKALPLALLLAAAPASAASPREQLKTLTAQLKTASSDDALRSRIIALAKTLKPAPAVPEEARRAFIRGNTAFKGAKDASAYARASARYEEASNLAPWWPDPYFNRAKADDAAGNPGAALRTLKFYVAAANTAAEKRQGQDLIYELEEKSAGKDADAAAAANAATAQRSRVERSIEGTWWGLADDGTPYSAAMFSVTRKADGFDVKMLDEHSFVNNVISATETTLVLNYGPNVTLDVRREGDLLVGKQSSGSFTETLRFVRK